jgi:Zn-dependent protease
MLERISRHEFRDLVIAWLAISVSFAIIFLRRSTFPVEPVHALVLFGISFVTVGIGFVLHEMAHKFTAMRYGFWAEFRKDNIMLLVAVALAALIGVVFAAPGATIISGYSITREQNGRISAAGPITNLLLCIPFAALLLSAGMFSGLSTQVAGLIGMVGLQVNAMIAAFNMLPVSVLDGRKVLAWNPAVFAILIIAAFAVLIGSYSLLPLIGAA